MRRMIQIPRFLKKKLSSDGLGILLFIIIIALFFRSYEMVDRFYFAHDGDLFSWIVKDIVTNGHWRLIGQQTSSAGIFIGPLFYYSLIPFFLIASMDPVGSLFFALLLSVITVISYHFVFLKLFDRVTAVIAAYLQSTIWSRVGYDMWIVPTITTTLWEIWYFYCIIMLTKGNFYIFPILGILISLIWHINLSLAPILIAVPLAVGLSKKIPSKEDLLRGLATFIVFSIPFFLFELKHNFIQIRSLLLSFGTDQGGGTGISKFWHVLDQVAGNSTGVFFYPSRDIFIPHVIFFLLILLSLIFLRTKKIITGKMLLVLYVWIFSMISFFTFSSKIISEYYFSNLNIVFLAAAILILSFVFKYSLIGKMVVVAIFIIVFARSLELLINQPVNNLLGYSQRKAVVKYIANDSRSRGFPCVAVSYITVPGENVGFRYFFYLNNLHVNQPSSNSPIYTIVVPYGLASEAAKLKFGMIGIIPPEGDYDSAKMRESCSGGNSNLTDPMFGYTE